MYITGFISIFLLLLISSFVLLFTQAAILQHTADYIYQLEQEKTRLLSQNCQLKRLVSKQEGELLSTANVHKKRKMEDSTGKYLYYNRYILHNRGLQIIHRYLLLIFWNVYFSRIRDLVGSSLTFLGVEAI